MESSILICRVASISDAEFFWHCWNDPLTQRMMKNGGPVPWADHFRWFTNEIGKPGGTLFVVGTQQDGVGIGVVRFIKQAEKLFDVSLIIAPEFRGRGYASSLVAASVVRFKENRGAATLFAGFKKVNIPSQRAFLAAGFALCDVSVLPVTPKTAIFDRETELMSILRVD